MMVLSNLTFSLQKYEEKCAGLTRVPDHVVACQMAGGAKESTHCREKEETTQAVK